MTGEGVVDAGREGGVLLPHDKISASESRVHEIDGLRGIAILSVVVYHLLVLPLSPFFSEIGMKSALKLLAYGVDLFFVVSGFLIGTILLKVESPAGIGAFYLRRILRIWPLYYLLLFFVYSALTNKAMFSEAPLWSFPLFIFNFWESIGKGIHQALGPLWSVAVEEQFYILGPLLFSVLNRKQVSIFLLACFFLSPVLRLALLYNTDLDLWRFSPARIDGICAGLLLAIFLSSSANVLFAARNIRFLKYLMYLLLILLIPSKMMFPNALWTTLGHSLVVLAFACVLLVVQVQCSLNQRIRLLNWGPLRYLGLRCYSIYLFHIFFSLIAIAVYDNFYADLVIESVLILGFAHLAWRYLEAPFMKFGRRFSYRGARKHTELDRAAA